MAFHVHRANRLEDLVAVLAALPAPSGDPFAPETFVIPTRGVERWLGMRLAERRGVFAHARFLAIEDFLEEVLGGKANDAWRPGHLVWHIAEVLAGVADEAELAPLRTWLGAETPSVAAPGVLGPRTLQLASRLAEVFYRYALHRPDIVAAWSAGVTPDGFDGINDLAQHAWQGALWRKVAAHVGDAAWPGRRLEAFIAAVAAMRDDEDLPASVPARVVLFGHHTLAPLHLDALVAIASRREVHLMRPATSRAIADRPDVVLHPLRGSLDRLGRELDKLLSDRHIVQTTLIGDPLPPPATQPYPATALQRLQSSILAGPVEPPVAGIAPTDRSLRFHACHGALRQVEALRDELLRLFDGDATLEPRDVCVMTPDIELYAPLIDAVFKDGDRGSPALAPDDPRVAGFPALHRVHDQSMRRANPAVEAFLGILDLAGSRLERSRVTDLLAMTPILGKTGLEPDHIDQVRTWFDSAGVRWGLDAAWRARFDQPATPANTWRFGFDRLLLGHALATDGVLSFADVVPVDDVEGAESEVLGRVVNWLEDLFSVVVDLDRPRSVPAWRDTLGALVARLIVYDDPSAGLAQPILDELQALADRAAAGGFHGELELAAMRALLVDPFELRRPSVSFLSGGLTFCAMLPMRTVPFRVIGMLGMDEGAFPRQGQGLGFDLVLRAPRPGDRSAREDDRATFLETVLAARDHLVITWTGLRATDQKPMEPAGPVAELREAALRLFGDDASREPMLVTHALQPFSPKNFGAGPEGSDGTRMIESRSFDRRQARGAIAARGPRHAPPPQWTEPVIDEEAGAPVGLDDLVQCLSDPAKWFCSQRLRFSLSEWDVETRDREPIQLDQLEEWGLRDVLLGWELDGVPADDRARALTAAGRLPLGTPGRRKLRQLESQVRRIADLVRPHMRGAPERVPLDATLGGRRLVGFVDLVYGRSSRVVSQAGRTKRKHLVDLWVRHLALTVARDAPSTSLLVANDAETRLDPLVPGRARAFLAELLALYAEARSAPLTFFPETSWAWLDAVRAGRDPGPEVREKWDGKDGERRWASDGEAHEPHVTLLFGHRFAPGFPLDDGAFRGITSAVLGPLLDHCRIMNERAERAARAARMGQAKASP